MDWAQAASWAPHAGADAMIQDGQVRQLDGKKLEVNSIICIPKLRDRERKKKSFMSPIIYDLVNWFHKFM